MMYETQVRLLLLWLVLAQLAAVALTVVVVLRKAPPLTTQTNRQTGMREHGLGKWFLVLSAVCVAPPLLVLLVVTAQELTDRLPVWVWPIAASAGLLALVLAVYRRHRPVPQRVTLWEELGEPATPTAPSPAVGWSLPADAQQWDQPTAGR